MNDRIKREDVKSLLCKYCDYAGICDKNKDCPPYRNLNEIPAAPEAKDLIDRFLPELERAYKVLPYFVAELQNERDIAGWLDCGILECVADADALRAINRGLSRTAERMSNVYIKREEVHQ